jgi:hypothetical protein
MNETRVRVSDNFAADFHRAPKSRSRGEVGCLPPVCTGRGRVLARGKQKDSSPGHFVSVVLQLLIEISISFVRRFWFPLYHVK